MPKWKQTIIKCLLKHSTNSGKQQGVVELSDRIKNLENELKATNDEKTQIQKELEERVKKR